ncbi:MAG: hypothetical protein D4R84_12835 [Rhodocyclaceae bacterium]|nr:MAG: hypothetical protein D4R84_12835 [Rhodocyclaceae bacterium]
MADLDLDFASPKQATILFLDFDGVLHPVHSDPGRHLCCLPLLDATLGSLPPVDIVISSTWQEAYSIKTLAGRFAPAIASRIIGGTLMADPDREEETRYAQIRRFLKWKNWAARHWVALDDAEHEFPQGCAQLVRCDPAKGFDERAAQGLLQCLTN